MFTSSHSEQGPGAGRAGSISITPWKCPPIDEIDPSPGVPLEVIRADGN